METKTVKRTKTAEQVRKELDHLAAYCKVSGMSDGEKLTQDNRIISYYMTNHIPLSTVEEMMEKGISTDLNSDMIYHIYQITINDICRWLNNPKLSDRLFIPSVRLIKSKKIGQDMPRTNLMKMLLSKNFRVVMVALSISADNPNISNNDIRVFLNNPIASIRSTALACLEYRDAIIHEDIVKTLEDSDAGVVLHALQIVHDNENMNKKEKIDIYNKKATGPHHGLVNHMAYQYLGEILNKEN